MTLRFKPFGAFARFGWTCDHQTVSLGSSSLVRAVVVRTIVHGEADCIVHAVTENGRLCVYAYAAKHSRRRFGGALEPFATVDLELARVRPGGKLRALESAHLIRPRLGLREDLGRLALAAYFAELGWTLGPEGAPLPELFELCEHALDRLSIARPSAVLRRAFEVRLLDVLGYRPDLDQCVACGGNFEDAFLDFRRGGTLCARHRGAARPVGPKTLIWMRRVLGTSEPLIPTSPEGAFDECAGLDAAWAERAARLVAHPLVEFYRVLLEYPLKSRTLLESLDLG